MAKLSGLRQFQAPYAYSRSVLTKSSDYSPSSEQELVQWHDIQRNLELASNDILLLFDCCFSATAGRGKAHGARVEMICATAKREKTPPPGPWSWTHALMRLLERSIETAGSTSVERLARDLLSKGSGLPATSNHVVFRSGFPSRSIELRPLDISDRGPSQMNLDGPCIRLLIHVSDLNTDRIKEVAVWLRTDIPKDVFLKVDGIMQTTEALQTLVKSIDDTDKPLQQALASDS